MASSRLPRDTADGVYVGVGGWVQTRCWVWRGNTLSENILRNILGDSCARPQVSGITCKKGCDAHPSLLPNNI